MGHFRRKIAISLPTRSPPDLSSWIGWAKRRPELLVPVVWRSRVPGLPWAPLNFREIRDLGKISGPLFAAGREQIGFRKLGFVRPPGPALHPKFQLPGRSQFREIGA